MEIGLIFFYIYITKFTDGEANCNKYLPTNKRLQRWVHVVACTNVDTPNWDSLSYDRWVVMELLPNTETGEIQMFQRADPSTPIKTDRSNALSVSFIEKSIQLYETHSRQQSFENENSSQQGKHVLIISRYRTGLYETSQYQTINVYLSHYLVLN